MIDGTTGFLVSDDGEMMTRLAQLLASADLRRSLGQAGRSHVAKFSWDAITRQWEEIFLRLARTKDAQS